MFPKVQLLRVVLTPEEQILLDLRGRQNGRGAYVCKNVECLRQARKKKSLERALKTAIPSAIYDDLEQTLVREAMDVGHGDT
jgi:predicted RNA-binding protein YlxR (DUF448 family)